MAVSVDWAQKVINIPRADMPVVQADPEIRELDLDVLRLTLKSLEDDEDGMPWPDTHRHETESTMGGITYARKIEFINGYTVTCEAGDYGVNAVGANSNLMDVMNFNGVSLRSANAAGLIVVTGGEAEKDWTEQEHDDILADLSAVVSKTANLPADPASESSISDLSGDIAAMQAVVDNIFAVESGKWEIVGSQMRFYKDGNVLVRVNLYDADGNLTSDLSKVRKRVPV